MSIYRARLRNTSNALSPRVSCEQMLVLCSASTLLRVDLVHFVGVNCDNFSVTLAEA